jgi:hypothetical protein
MITFLAEKVNVNYDIYKNGLIYLSVIITIICFLNFTEPNGVYFEISGLSDVCDAELARLLTIRPSLYVLSAVLNSYIFVYLCVHKSIRIKIERFE